MNAPGALPLGPAASLRTRPSSGGEVRGSSGASPFASALDDALAADCPQPGSDRAAERRSTPDERVLRALDRAADARTRAERATDRSARHQDRAAARAERAAEAAARRATPASSGGTTTAPTSDAPARADVPEEAAATTGAPVPALPSALWALALGGPLTTVGQAEASTAVAADAVPGVPAVGPTGAAPDLDVALPAPAAAPATVGTAPGTATPAAAVPAQAGATAEAQMARPA